MPQSKSVYAGPGVPHNYYCATCKARGSKLWRLYNTFLEYQELFCVVCAVEDQKASETAPRDPAAFDADGRADGPYGKGDQIGWLIPAVPTDDNSTFWGYTSVPEEGCHWWRALPTQPSHAMITVPMGAVNPPRPR